MFPSIEHAACQRNALVISPRYADLSDDSPALDAVRLGQRHGHECGLAVLSRARSAARASLHRP